MSGNQTDARGQLSMVPESEIRSGGELLGRVSLQEYESHIRPDFGPMLAYRGDPDGTHEVWLYKLTTYRLPVREVVT